MFDNMSSNKRLLIAVVIAAVFFVIYDYFMPKPPINEQTEQKSEQSTSVTAQSQNQHTNQSLSSLKITDGKVIATLKSSEFSASINEQGEISEFKLTSERYLSDNEPTSLLDPTALKPLNVSFYEESSRPEFNDKYSKTPYEIASISDLQIELKKSVDGVEITKTITFEPSGFYTATMHFSAPAPAYVITPGSRPNVLADSYTVHGGMIYRADDTKSDYEDKDIKATEEISESNVTIAAFSDRYYTSFIYDFNKPFSVILNSANDLTQGFIKASGDASFAGYIGPKEHARLQAKDERLVNVVEYGWFTFIAKPMFSFLNFIHNNTANWGWAIVIMTIIIRIILFPLTYKSMMSMQKLKVLAPKIKELQEKYKGDPAKLQTHMMQLYKKHGANPLGGCLPILIQIPIFFAIYRVLLNAIELKAAPWALWINDLSLHDPFYVLPIYMGVTMFLQQHLTPMSVQDPTQAKIMKFLPVIFVIFFISFPAGLTLYWCVNNTFSLLQQLLINKLFKAAKHDNH